MDHFLPVFPEHLGLLAIGLTVCGLIPYVSQTWTQHIQPARATWMIWAVLATMSASAQMAAGSGPGIWFGIAQASATVLVAMLVLRNGRGHVFTLREVLVLAIAALGILVWQFTSEPGYALAISISVSAWAAMPTLAKAYRLPSSENVVTWALQLLGSLCALAAIGTANPMLLAYPLYLATLYAAILTAMTLGRVRILQPA